MLNNDVMIKIMTSSKQLLMNLKKTQKTCVQKFKFVLAFKRKITSDFFETTKVVIDNDVITNIHANICKFKKFKVETTCAPNFIVVAHLNSEIERESKFALCPRSVVKIPRPGKVKPHKENIH